MAWTDAARAASAAVRRAHVTVRHGKWMRSMPRSTYAMALQHARRHPAIRNMKLGYKRRMATHSMAAMNLYHGLSPMRDKRGRVVMAYKVR